jgi:pilus assembly protein CpaD
MKRHWTLTLASLMLPLGACAPDRVVTGSTYPMDYRERHPVVLTNAPRTLDVFVGGGLDQRQRDDIAAFAAEYRSHGQGLVTADVPTGARAGSRNGLGPVREALAEAGVPGERVVVTSYPVSDPQLAAPIRLSFKRLQAKVASRCGLWPQDLGVSDVKTNAGNEPYWNLGCAMQTNVAAQTADPVDLVRGRTETRVDTMRRMSNIEKLRQGQDPSTQYTTKATTISNAVGN